MKKAGRYSFRLAPAELQTLLNDLVASGIATTSSDRYNETIETLKSDADLQYSSDPTTLSVSLNIAVSGAGATGRQRTTEGELIAPNLQMLRSQHPTDALTSSLGAGFDMLDKLTVDPRMVKQ